MTKLSLIIVFLQLITFMNCKIIFFITSFIFMSKAMGQKYETQAYKVVRVLSKLEIRYYPPVMKIQSENNFGSLFRYISGNNQNSKKIAMTTPVYMGNYEGQDVMEFVLPNSFNEANTPKSESSDVRVFQSTPGYFIALEFGGYATQNNRNKHTDQLIALAKQNNLKTIGSPLLLVYHSPYRIFNRKNEVLLEIEYLE